MNEIVDSMTALVADRFLKVAPALLERAGRSQSVADYLWRVKAIEEGVEDLEAGVVSFRYAEIHRECVRAYSLVARAMPGLEAVDQVGRSTYFGAGYVSAVIVTGSFPIEPTLWRLDLAVRILAPEYETIWGKYKPFFFEPGRMKQMGEWMDMVSSGIPPNLSGDQNYHFNDFLLGALTGSRSSGKSSETD